MTNHPGWAVELIGEKFDVDDLRIYLAVPFDPWVENYSTDAGATALLRSRHWNDFNKAGDVTRDAGRMIDRVNGALLLTNPDAKAVKLGHPIRFGSDGKRQHILSAEAGHFRMTGGRIRMTIGGDAVSTSNAKLKLNKLLKEAEFDDTCADLLVHLNRADNWFDLFKSMELARRRAGGKSKLELILAADAKEFNRIWQTANCYRHAPNPIKYPLPSVPAEFESARDAILRILSRLF